MQNKLYTEDDLREVFGMAIEVIRQGLTTGSPSERCAVAAEILRIPLTSILMRGQEERERFPKEIDTPADGN